MEEKLVNILDNLDIEQAEKAVNDDITVKLSNRTKNRIKSAVFNKINVTEPAQKRRLNPVTMNFAAIAAALLLIIGGGTLGVYLMNGGETQKPPEPPANTGMTLDEVLSMTDEKIIEIANDLLASGVNKYSVPNFSTPDDFGDLLIDEFHATLITGELSLRSIGTIPNNTLKSMESARTALDFITYYTLKEDGQLFNVLYRNLIFEEGYIYTYYDVSVDTSVNGESLTAKLTVSTFYIDESNRLLSTDSSPSVLRQVEFYAPLTTPPLPEVEFISFDNPQIAEYEYFINQIKADYGCAYTKIQAQLDHKGWSYETKELHCEIHQDCRLGTTTFISLLNLDSNENPLCVSRTVAITGLRQQMCTIDAGTTADFLSVLEFPSSAAAFNYSQSNLQYLTEESYHYNPVSFIKGNTIITYHTSSSLDSRVIEFLEQYYERIVPQTIEEITPSDHRVQYVQFLYRLSTDGFDYDAETRDHKWEEGLAIESWYNVSIGDKKGENVISVFGYADQKSLQTTIDGVKGTHHLPWLLGIPDVHWTSTVHWFNSDSLILLYVGDDKGILEFLRRYYDGFSKWTAPEGTTETEVTTAVTTAPEPPSCKVCAQYDGHLTCPDCNGNFCWCCCGGGKVYKEFFSLLDKTGWKYEIYGENDAHGSANNKIDMMGVNVNLGNMGTIGVEIWQSVEQAKIMYSDFTELDTFFIKENVVFQHFSDFVSFIPNKEIMAFLAKHYG